MLLRGARYIFTVVIILTFLYPHTVWAFGVSCNIQPQKIFPQNLQESFRKDFCRMPTEVFHLKPKVGLWKSRNNWKYNNIDQLIQATHPSLPEENITYDALGNRNPLVNTYNEANRLLSDGQYSYTYDSNGNRITREDIDTGEIITYTYNAENQLTAINYPLSTINYFYDGLGRRISKTINNPLSTINYIYDGMDVLAEYNGADELIYSYIHGPGVDEPLEINNGASTYYYIRDGLGSITAIIDGSGNIIEQYRYDSFGNVTIFNALGEEIPESAYGNRYMFTAREYDTETGLYYYRLRYYDPLVGRFLQEDPVGYLQGPNLYTYVHNNPVNWMDPFGLYDMWGPGDQYGPDYKMYEGKSVPFNWRKAVARGISAGVVGATTGGIATGGSGALVGGSVGFIVGFISGGLDAGAASSVIGGIIKGSKSGPAGMVGGVASGLVSGVMNTPFNAETYIVSGFFKGTAAGMVAGGILGSAGGLSGAVLGGGLGGLYGGLIGGIEGFVEHLLDSTSKER